MTMTYEDCLDFDPGNGDCTGEVVERPSMSPTGIWYPRCEGHYAKRLDTQRGIVSRYGGQMFYDGPERDEDW